jgi:hypothetical protein
MNNGLRGISEEVVEAYFKTRNILEVCEESHDSSHLLNMKDEICTPLTTVSVLSAKFRKSQIPSLVSPYSGYSSEGIIFESRPNNPMSCFIIDHDHFLASYLMNISPNIAAEWLALLHRIRR